MIKKPINKYMQLTNRIPILKEMQKTNKETVQLNTERFYKMKSPNVNSNGRILCFKPSQSIGPKFIHSRNPVMYNEKLMSNFLSPRLFKGQ